MLKQKYKEALLPNGLRIISVENPTAVASTVAFWFKTGSRYESQEDLGYAHILEHMLFKGTKKRPSGMDIALEKDYLGAFSNAHTRRESVDFWIEVASEYTEPMFELLSDMILNSTINESALEKERLVIIEELHQITSEPNKLLSLIAMNRFFIHHPLAKHPIGEEKTITVATSEALKKYYRNFYTPDRAVIIVSGPLTLEQVTEMAKKYLGEWDAKSKVENNFSEYISTKKADYIFKNNVTPNTYLLMGYHTPGASCIKEVTALNLVSRLLTTGFSSLLMDEIRTKRGLVYGISSGQSAFADAGMFSISTSSAKPIETVIAITNVIKDLSKTITEELLTRLKIQSKNRFLLLISDQSSEMNFLGSNFIDYGHLISPDQYLDLIEKVSLEDMHGVVRKYLIPENSLLAVVGPKEIKSELPEPYKSA